MGPTFGAAIDGGFDASARDDLVKELAAKLASLSASDRLVYVCDVIPGPIVLTTSFGLEDQVITHLLSERGLRIEVVTIDTGRLFPETYALWAATERRYGRRVRAVYPRQGDLEALIDAQGINGFYDSVEARRCCCRVRKIEPLGRAVAGASGWITGLRADQSLNRMDAGLASNDGIHRLIKVNPLFDWTRDAAEDFVQRNNVPINPLHERGFVSIGCAPCTRAIHPGEAERAGRWWWEDDTQKECGLHLRRELHKTSTR